MADEDVSFDDVALLRAVTSLGAPLHAKVDRLVKPIGELMVAGGLGTGDPRYQGGVLGKHRRAIFWRYLVEGSNNPYLMAGIVTHRGPAVAVWIESAARHPLKREIREACVAALPLLTERRAGWTHDPNRRMADLELRLPLRHLLDADDQQATVVEFITVAIRDLVEAGLGEQFSKIVRP